MNTKFFILGCALFCTTFVFGQGKEKSDFLETIQNKESATLRQNNSSSHITNKESNYHFIKRSVVKGNKETVLLYSKLVKRYGRWEGYGKPISKDFASHLDCYYRLTFLNDNKYPSRMEAYDGYHHLTTNHNIGTYLVNQNSETDKGADSIWVEMLKNVCQWDFVYNEKNDIVMERAFDKDSTMVYTYHPSKIGSKTAGTFTDAWGMPARLRSDSTGGGNVVYISYDKNGFESLLEFMDKDGFRQTNKDGAYMTRKTYTKNGLQISDASCNIVGELMIDNFGNSGWTAEYNNNEDSVFSIYRDDKWEPIRINNNRDPFHNNVIKTLQRYDEYGRAVEYSFWDLENRPDTNSIGIHAIRYKYNTRGRQILMTYHDINGNLCINKQNGIAGWENGFDDAGRILYTRTFDEHSQLANFGNNCCSRYFYNKHGDIIERYDSVIVGQDIKLQYSSIIYKPTKEGLKKLKTEDVVPLNHTEIRRWYDEDLQIYIENDSKGRNTLWKYSNLSGQPVNHKEDMYCCDINEYIDKDTIIINTETYLDEQGKLTYRQGNDWAKEISIIHNKNGIDTYRDVFRYDKDTVLFYSYRLIYNHEGDVIAQMTLNRYGIPARTAVDGAIYYKTDVERTYKGDYSAFIAKNEFNEPSYFYKNYNSAVCHYSNFVNDVESFYDEHGNLINDMAEFRDSISAVMTIIITDSVGYKLGLKDNDVIVKYGNWVSDLNLQKTASQNAFYVEMIDKALSDKNILLLRHFPDEGRSEVVNISLPQGNIEELGFFPQLTYYTSKETERYKHAVQEYLERENITELSGIKEEQGSHTAIIRIPKWVGRNTPTMGNLQSHIYNPGFVLSFAHYEVESDNIIAHEYWNFGMSIDTLKTMFKQEQASSDIFYISTTSDLSSSYDGFPYYDDMHVWRLVYLNDDQYNKLNKVYRTFIDNRGSAYDSSYIEQPPVTDRRLTPERFFKNARDKGFTYMENCTGIINSDSTVLSKAFDKMQRIYIGKNSPMNGYMIIKKSVKSINSDGFIKLPNFYNEDLALVKKKDDGFSELFLVYVLDENINLYYHKGFFNKTDLLGIQKRFGDKNARNLGEGIDIRSTAIIHVENDGRFRENNLEGYFVLISFNNWHIGQDLEILGKEIESSREHEHKMEFAELLFDNENSPYLGKYYNQTFAPGLLGLRFLDYNLPIELYDSTIKNLKNKNK